MAGYAVQSLDAPEAIGPYSQAVRVGQTIYLSGQIALDPKTMELNCASFRDEVQQVFANIQTVLKAAGAGIEDVVKFTVFLTDISTFDTVNAVMSEVCKHPFPARSALGVAALPRGANIEVETIAVVNSS
ncbi:MAG: Rid family detoxifying hydrolase [Gammaproteobacteria bacterium]|nr:Rid family detoxifying hydrolase [Gammaproteobacteria bacterium]